MVLIQFFDICHVSAGWHPVRVFDYLDKSKEFKFLPWMPACAGMTGLTS